MATSTARTAMMLLAAAAMPVNGLTLSRVGSPALRLSHCAVLLPASMQTAVPDAPTITRPDTLPESWVVPDTFTFGAPKSEEPPFFKITLFKSSKFDADYVASALIKTMGLEKPRATEIAKQAQTLGFATVGEYVQEVAEMYSQGLKDQGLVVDVSATSR